MLILSRKKKKKVIGIFENKNRSIQKCIICATSLQPRAPKRWSENRNILVLQMVPLLEIGLTSADLQDCAATVGKSSVTRSF